MILPQYFNLDSCDATIYNFGVDDNVDLDNDVNADVEFVAVDTITVNGVADDATLYTDDE